MRIPFVTANWKMNKTVSATLDYIDVFNTSEQEKSRIEVALAPPFTSLYAAAQAVSKTTTLIAGQDLHWEAEGAFTGQVSAVMLKEAGATYVIIGHSERRHIFGETDNDVNRKVHAAIENGLNPILCVGETLDNRETEQTKSVLDRQLTTSLMNLPFDHVNRLIVAYEPVWAIGTGHVATPEQAQEVHAHIRLYIGQVYGQDAANHCRIIYGGSVKQTNVAEIVSQPDVDGVLVGGASLEPKSFVQIVEKTANPAL